MTEPVQITFKFSPAMLDCIDTLVETTDATTRAEVLRRAISIYAIIVDEQKNGGTAYIIDQNGKRFRLKSS